MGQRQRCLGKTSRFLAPTVLGRAGASGTPASPRIETVGDIYAALTGSELGEIVVCANTALWCPSGSDWAKDAIESARGHGVSARDWILSKVRSATALRPSDSTNTRGRGRTREEAFDALVRTFDNARHDLETRPGPKPFRRLRRGVIADLGRLHRHTSYTVGLPTRVSTECADEPMVSPPAAEIEMLPWVRFSWIANALADFFVFSEVTGAETKRTSVLFRQAATNLALDLDEIPAAMRSLDGAWRQADSPSSARLLFLLHDALARYRWDPDDLNSAMAARWSEHPLSWSLPLRIHPSIGGEVSDFDAGSSGKRQWVVRLCRAILKEPSQSTIAAMASVAFITARARRERLTIEDGVRFLSDLHEWVPSEGDKAFPAVQKKKRAGALELWRQAMPGDVSGKP